MRFVKIGDAEVDAEKVTGFVQTRDSTARVKVLIFLSSGQTVTTTLRQPVPNLSALLRGEN